MTRFLLSARVLYMPLHILLGLLFIAGPVYAEWVEVASSNDGFMAYMYPDTVRVNGSLVRMWTMYDFHKPRQDRLSSRKYLSTKMQEEFDCKEQQSRILAFTDYEENMGKGKVLNTYAGSYSWSPIAPDTIGEVMWRVACGK